MENDEEQRALLASVSDLVERVLGDRHETLSGAAFCRETWNKLGGELGLLGAALPDDLGGMDAGQEGHAILMEAFGRHLVVQPYISGLVIVSALLEQVNPDHAEWLGKIASGETIIVPALSDGPGDHDLRAETVVAAIDGASIVLDGTKTLVRDAPLADHFVVLVRLSGDGAEERLPALLLVDAAARGLNREDFRMVDGAVGSHLNFEAVRLDKSCLIATGQDAMARARRAIDEAIVSVCAEAIGVMKAMLAQTIEYAGQRVQFGRAIAEFQVLQHRMVDMHVAIEQAESITRLAAGKLRSDDRAKAVSACMALVAKACRSVAQDAVQIHGAVGIADETPISRYFRRAFAIEKQFGGRSYHLARYIDCAASS